MNGNRWQGIAEKIHRTATAKGRAQTGCFSIEGLRLFERSLRAGVAIEEALVAESSWHGADQRLQAVLTELQATPCQIVTVPDGVMAELTAGRGLGGLLGLIRQPASPDLADLLTRPQEHPALFLVAVDVVDPGNVGALLRTGHALGIAAFLAVGVSDPFHPKATRTTMGSLFRVPVHHYSSSDALLAQLRKLGVLTIGSVAHNGRLLPHLSLPSQPTAVLAGNEYWGLPDDLCGKLDLLVTIPMAAGIDSLSVNAATAVVLYEVSQKLNQPKSDR